mmetsp:Transcript_96312/g.254361  ORF Transcript_96312/g.254361 Transcript_96312/m.254361 type:complete len:457 (-) Transcript_96312:65-1435(-)
MEPLREQPPVQGHQPAVVRRNLAQLLGQRPLQSRVLLFRINVSHRRHVPDQRQELVRGGHSSADARLDVRQDALARVDAADKVVRRRDYAVGRGRDVVRDDHLLPVPVGRLVKRAELAQVALRLAEAPLLAEPPGVELREGHAAGVVRVHLDQFLLHDTALVVPEGREGPGDRVDDAARVLERIARREPRLPGHLPLEVHGPDLPVRELLESVPVRESVHEGDAISDEGLNGLDVVAHHPIKCVVLQHLLQALTAYRLVHGHARVAVHLLQQPSVPLGDELLDRRHHVRRVREVEAPLLRVLRLERGLHGGGHLLAQDVGRAHERLVRGAGRLEAADHDGGRLHEVAVGHIPEQASLDAAVARFRQGVPDGHQRLLHALQLLLPERLAAAEHLPQRVTELALELRRLDRGAHGAPPVWEQLGLGRHSGAAERREDGQGGGAGEHGHVGFGRGGLLH